MRNIKGFTMVEILITALLVGILGLGALFAVSSSNRVLNASVKQTLANSNIQLVMNQVSNDVRGGVLLATPGTKELKITYTDGKTISWSFNGGSLYRKNSAGTTKKILLQGGSDIEIDGTFAVDNSTKYHKAVINFQISLSDGNTFEVASIQNAFYCKLENSGFIIP